MGTLTFVETMAVFSTVCHVLLYTAIFAFAFVLYIKCRTFSPHLGDNAKSSKHGTFAGLYLRHVRGLGA